jgi:phage tail P2-like protein
MTSAYDALNQVAAERFSALDTKLPEKGRDPMRIHESQLGHLAWSRGLDYWGDFTLATKRALANQAPANLRIRGTRAAIDNAIAAFATELELEEWWETDPQGARGTATATIVSGSYLETDAEGQDTVARLLLREGRRAVHCTLITLVAGVDAIGDEQHARVGQLYHFSGVQTGA